MLAGANAFWLGQLSFDSSDYTGAEPWIKRYQEHSEQMYTLAPNDFNSIMELSYSYNSLGSLYLKQFDYALAKQSFTESLKLKNQALELKPNNKNLLRDKTDTISWIASTEENLGHFNEALKIFEHAENEASKMLTKYPADASVLTSLAYKHIQQSYLLSYFPDKSKSYEKAKQATETINKARLQDVQNKTIERTYYQFLAYQLSLSDDPNIDIKVSEIIEFLDTNKSSKSQIISIKISLIEYLINRKNMKMALEILKSLDENNMLSNALDIESVRLHTRILLIKASLAETQQEKNALCENAATILDKISKKTKSINFTFPLIQAYTCLNKSHEIEATIVPVKKLGIINFKL